MEKICEFCKYSGDIKSCKLRGAKQRGNQAVVSTEACRPAPTQLTREQFRALATPLLDEQEYIDMMLYKNEMLLGRPDGYLIIPDTLDAVQGKLIAKIKDGQPIGVIGVYDSIIKNVAVARKEVLNELVNIAIKHGANKFEDVFPPELADYIYEWYKKSGQAKVPLPDEIEQDIPVLSSVPSVQEPATVSREYKKKDYKMEEQTKKSASVSSIAHELEQLKKHRLTPTVITGLSTDDKEMIQLFFKMTPQGRKQAAIILQQLRQDFDLILNRNIQRDS